jgi:hypothetical protein
MPPGATAVEVRGWDAALKARVEGPAPTAPPVVAGEVFVRLPGSGPVERDDEVLVAFESGDVGGIGRPVQRTLLYSPDGEHWQVVAAGRTDGEARVRARDLPSGEAPAFRVLAFDGWSSDETTIAVPDLAAPRNPPQVQILAAAPARYPTGGLVRLEATAFDLEDRAIPGVSIRWSSDVDGDLGPGGELATRDLSPGRHVITATAVDSDGLTGSATYALEVDPAVSEPVPSQALVEAMGATFASLAAGLPPDGDGDNHRDFLWAPIAVAGLLLVLLAGGTYAFRRRRLAAGTQLSVEVTQPEAGGHKASGANELSMDDTAGKESADDHGDMTVKGSKIKEN